MDFDQAEKYVTSLLKFGIDLGLGRIGKYLDHLKYPWDELKFIHVGGTNGKGSTAAMISGILRQAGYRVGLYTSPHIESYCERISVDGKTISRESFAEIVAEIASTMNIVFKGEEHLTEFELLTVTALEYFRRKHVDVAVMEVGMGGRFDATNVIPKAEISVITNISMDHGQHLGYSLTEIAYEKAGIIKKGGCLITAEESPEVRQIFIDRCHEVGADFLYLGDEVKWKQGDIAFAGGTLMQKCSIQSFAYNLDDLSLRMLGRHQIINGATALLSAQALLGKGFAISQEDVQCGLETTMIPGRLEIVYSRPLVILDAAHNAAGVEALKSVIFSIFSNKPLVLVTGVLDDKEQDKIARAWGKHLEWVVVTRPESSRSNAWEQLAQSFSRYLNNICVIENIQTAVARGWELTGKDGILCIAGSFYLLKPARRKLQLLTVKN